MSNIIKASEVNTLREFINYEVERSGYPLNPTGTAVQNQLIDDSWWESIRANLQKAIDTTGGSAVAGDKITRVQRDELVNQALVVYGRTISRP